MKIKNYKIFASFLLLVVLALVIIIPSVSTQTPPEPDPPVPPPGLPINGGLWILLVSGIVYGIKKKLK